MKRTRSPKGRTTKRQRREPPVAAPNIELPGDMVVLIALRLDTVASIVTMSSVNKLWRQACEQSTDVWKHLNQLWCTAPGHWGWSEYLPAVGESWSSFVRSLPTLPRRPFALIELGVFPCGAALVRGGGGLQHLGTCNTCRNMDRSERLSFRGTRLARLDLGEVRRPIEGIDKLDPEDGATGNDEQVNVEAVLYPYQEMPTMGVPFVEFGRPRQFYAKRYLVRDAVTNKLSIFEAYCANIETNEWKHTRTVHPYSGRGRSAELIGVF